MPAERHPTPKMDALRIARSRAIESYARVELSLNELFSELLGTTNELGGVAFFRIAAANARFKIIERLLKKRFGGKYKPYWVGNKEAPGMLSALNNLARKRNEIVHWTVVLHTLGQDVKMPGPEVGEWVLEPPNIWDQNSERDYLETADLDDFAAEADYIQHSIFIFALTHAKSYPAGWQTDVPDAWRGIFERTYTYPPPIDHPAHTRWKKRENPRQSYRL